MSRRNHGNTNPRSARRVRRNTETIRRAATLRAAGATFAEIGKALGCHTSTAHRLVTDALTNAPYEAADEMRSMEGARLDRLQRAHWAAALEGDTKAALIILKILERRARLFGLDAPTETRVTETVEVADIDAETARLVHILEANDGRAQITSG